jgi:polysaccharide pyruvyl transferase WcaK-like protein
MTGGAVTRGSAPLRIGFFGRLASGNLGNDISMESMLGYLRAHHPDAVLDAMCPVPEAMRSRYGIDAVPLFAGSRAGRRSFKPLKAVGLALDKGMDAVRIMNWVRTHDVVIVPGMGILEALLPLRPWETPYSLFLLSLSGRLLRTKVIFVSVGASPAPGRATRTLQNWAARLAHYRSYRDEYSRESMVRRGVPAAATDPLYPDLAFAIPVPPYEPGDQQTVGIGVMQYSGGDGDRNRAAEISATYLAGMEQFVGWLVDNGYRVLLFIGDEDDQPVADAIAASVRKTRGGTAETAVTVHPVGNFSELTGVIQQASTVVAARFHNIIGALRLGKPTIAVSYGNKSAAVAADAGLSEFSLPANPLDAERLIERFKELHARADELVPRVRQSTEAKARLLDEQFARLDRDFFSATRKALRVSLVRAFRAGARCVKQERQQSRCHHVRVEVPVKPGAGQLSGCRAGGFVVKQGEQGGRALRRIIERPEPCLDTVVAEFRDRADVAGHHRQAGRHGFHDG